MVGPFRSEKTSIVTPLLVCSVHLADHEADRDGGTSVVVVHFERLPVSGGCDWTKSIGLKSPIS